MRLKAIRLRNFRCYRTSTTIPIGNLTALIGRNDAGKSTVLEALDIFFEGGTIKIDPSDASMGGESANVQIGAVFSDLPTTLDLDAGAQTTLSAEWLLNADGDLEILKIYNCSVAGKVPKPKIFARAMHPTAEGASDLLQKRNADLKKLVREAGLEANCNQSSNPSMRQALYAAKEDLGIAETEVPLNDADAKNVWDAVRRRLPVYALFQSDRASRAQDPEVQSPMQLAVQKALAEVRAELDLVTTKVQSMAEETARRTLEQMRSAYPDMDLASVLKPAFETPNWKSVFKLDLESDDGIPLNKRGSGVRRLVLLSFFQAEAARVREEREEESRTSLPVIYAIEEPETSQHPDHQEKIISALLDMSSGKDQVLLTTHVPALAGLLPLDALRFVDRDSATREPRVRSGSEEVFGEIAKSLGVLPDAAHQERVSVAVAVEGPTDVDALMSLFSVLVESGVVQGFEQSRVFWTMGGGSTLKDWVERRYLDSLNVPQVYLFDSDRTSSVLPPLAHKEQQVSEINGRPNCQAFLTRKRTIENYVHFRAIERISGGRIVMEPGVDADFGDVAGAFESAVKGAKRRHGERLNFSPVDHRGNPLPLSKPKKIITSFVMRQMTAQEVLARGEYVNDAGETSNEITEWLDAINAHLAN